MNFLQDKAIVFVNFVSIYKCKYNSICIHLPSLASGGSYYYHPVRSLKYQEYGT